MRTNNFFCYLPIEVKPRELDTKIYLALKLAKKGFPVVIGKKSPMNKHMFFQKKPYIYIDKGISKGNLDFYNAIKSSNGYLVEIQEEGNIRLDSEILIKIHNNLSSRLFSLIFSWSKRAKKVIENDCHILENTNVVASGHPSFDMMHEDLIEYFKRLRKLNSKIKSGYILINTNFAKVNGIINFDEMRSYNNSDKEFHSEKDKKKHGEGKKFEKMIFLEFLKMINALSNSFVNKTIIIRPHPMEKKEFYEEKFKENDNIKVIFEGSSKEWIADADIVIHHDCTTGVEAFIAKKKVISFCPYNSEDHTIKLPQYLSMKFNNIENLINHLKNGYQVGQQLDLKKKNMKLLELTNNINKEYKKAADVIVLNFEKLCDAHKFKKRSIFKQGYYMVKIKIKSFLQKLNEISNKNLIIMKKKKFTNLKIEEVELRLNILRDLLSLKDDIKVEELKPNLFLIKKTCT